MSYYGTDLDSAEAAFDDPTDELEANAADDDPEGDLGDGADPRARRRSAAIEITPAIAERLRGKRGF